MSSFIAIDLGAGNIKAACPDESGKAESIRNQDGDVLTPSCVFFAEDGSILVGHEARNAAVLEPQYFRGDWKRFMGTDEVLITDRQGKEHLAKDIAEILLRHMKDTVQTVMGHPVSDAVITVPANYNDRQKAETEEAATGAGLSVIRLVSEPTAALFGVGLHTRGDGLYMVIDVGSSTSDVSLIRVAGNRVEVEATKGTSQAAGADITAEMEETAVEAYAQQFGERPDLKDHAQSFLDLRSRAESAKRSLANRQKVSVPFTCGANAVNVAITLDKLARRTKNILATIVQLIDDVLDEAGVKVTDLRELQLAGGGSLFPPLRHAIADGLGRPANHEGEPLLAVVKGAVVLGRMAIEQRGEKVQVGSYTLPPLNLGVRETTRYPISVCVVDDEGKRRSAVILAKGAPVPSTQMKAFRLAEPGQTDARIEVLQGEEGAAYEDCLLLGDFELTGLPAVYDEAHIIEITYRLNDSGMLNAEAYDPRSGVRNELQLTYQQAS